MGYVGFWVGEAGDGGAMDIGLMGSSVRWEIFVTVEGAERTVWRKEAGGSIKRRRRGGGGSSLETVRVKHTLIHAIHSDALIQIDSDFFFR